MTFLNDPNAISLGDYDTTAFAIGESVDDGYNFHCADH
jgi:hypothetical protein